MKVCLPILFSFLAILPLSAEPSAEDVRHWLHENVDSGAVYVWNEGGKAVETATSAVARAVKDGASWIDSHKDEAARTVIIVAGRTVDEAKDLWDAYGGTVGDTLLIVADVVVDGSREAYRYGKDFLIDTVTYYERHKGEMQGRLEAAMRAAKPYFDEGLIFVADCGDYIGKTAFEALLRGEKYYEDNKDRINEAVSEVVLWSGDRVDELADLARDKWLPSGRRLLGEAADYYEKEVGPRAEELGRRLASAASASADRILQKGSDLVEEYHNLPEGFALYLADTGGSALKYASEHGAELVPQIMDRAESLNRALLQAAADSRDSPLAKGIKLNAQSGSDLYQSVSGAARDAAPSLQQAAGAVQGAASSAARGAASAAQSLAPAAQKAASAASSAASSAARQASQAASGVMNSLGGLFGGNR
jgi:hypothetical protein